MNLNFYSLRGNILSLLSSTKKIKTADGEDTCPARSLFRRMLISILLVLFLAPSIASATHFGNAWADDGLHGPRPPGLFDAGVKFLANKASDAALGLVELLVDGIFWSASQFLILCGWLLDNAIRFTISRDLYASLQVINTGWTTVRDFSNMFFIFALLYIAIKTILGLGGGNTKRWVANLIIAAVLINFSLFATKVVVDAGNVLAMGFWERMEMTPGGGNPSAAQHLMQGLKVQTTVDTRDSEGNTIGSDPLNRIIIKLGGTVVMLIGGYVFLAGAIMMIIRTVSLILIMISSPFAFLGFGLPVGGGFAQKWLKELIANTFVAPAYLAMLFIVITIVNGLDLNRLSNSEGTRMAGVFSGDMGSFPIIYNFIIIIMLLLASLKVASAVSEGAGSHAGNLARKGMGGAYAGAAAFGGKAYRTTVGKYSAKQLENKELHHMATLKTPEGDAARKKIATLTKRANSTGDVRATGLGKSFTSGLGMVGINTGGEKSDRLNTKVGGKYGSYAGQRDKDEKWGEKTIEEEAKKMFPDNPEAQKHYIESKLGTAWTDTKRNEKAKKALDSAAAQEEAKKTMVTESATYDQLNAQIAAMKSSGASIAAVTVVEDQLKDSIDRMTIAMKLAGPKHFAEMNLDKAENIALLKSDAFKAAAGNDHWKALENRDDITDKTLLPEMRDNALKNGPPRTQEYLTRQMRNEESKFYVDHKKALGNEIATVNTNPAYVADTATIDSLSTMTGPLSTAQQTNLAQAQARVNTAHATVATRLGYMSPEKVAALDPTDLLQRSTAQSLTPAMIQEIIKTEKTTFKFGKPFFDSLQAQVSAGGNIQAQNFIARAATNKDSPFHPSYGTP